jgi:hypothetical protein
MDLSIGGVRIRIRDEGRAWGFARADPHADFVVEGPGGSDLDVEVRRGPAPALPGGPPVYSTEGGLWNLYRDARGLVFTLGAPAEGGALHRLARVDTDVRRGEVLITPAGDGPAFHPYPLRYPLDELLVINHLARGRGCVLHACGVRLKGSLSAEGPASDAEKRFEDRRSSGRSEQGWLFVGKSGAGKSTIADLWRGYPGAEVFSDDRVILRPTENGFRIYGTPWHGDARVSSRHSASLSNIYLLAHGENNRTVPVSPVEALEGLLVNCFAPYYDKEGMEWTLDLLSHLTSRIPVHRFEFLPDRTAIEHLVRKGPPGGRV